MRFNFHLTMVMTWLVAWIVACPSLLKAGPLEANRKLIVIDRTFPADKYILDQACIMIELYHRMDDDEALIYDSEAPEVVFGRISVRNLSVKPAEDSLAHALIFLKTQIQEMLETPVPEWTNAQVNLRKIFPIAWTNEDILASTDRIISRRGMRRSFLMSLENSSPYRQLMDSTFRAEGIPTRLTYLAHLESRFNADAVSRAGAAGIWQFLKSSGSRYLVIDDLVDQRMDPRRASKAAAKYLNRCRRNLPSWPLAIMAYNNGPGQMREAVKEMRSHDASNIIQKYQGGGFGSISRNYYAMFLAVSSLGMRSETLYPNLKKKSGLPFTTLKLTHEWTPNQLRILSGYSTAVLKRYNPSLRPVVFECNLPVPKGFELNLPAGRPSLQDLQFADLRVGMESINAEIPFPRRSLAGFPVPKFAENVLKRIYNALLPFQQQRKVPVMVFMDSQGLLNVNRLALAKRDRILIEPHPALQAVIRSMGG